MQEKDSLLSGCLVAYYRQDGEDPPVNFFRGSLNKFLQLSEIPPYGKVLNYSRENNREAKVGSNRETKRLQCNACRRRKR